MSVSRTSAARGATSSAVQIAPVGLCGELMTIIRVREVTAAASRSQSTAKSRAPSGTRTLVPPARVMAGSYRS